MMSLWFALIDLKKNKPMFDHSRRKDACMVRTENVKT